jgi:DNA-binding NarL/FixJ family response regulator
MIRRVVLGDENPRTRRGLKAVLEAVASIEVVGESANQHETLHIVDRKRPDVVLLDLKHPIGKGLDTVRTLREQWPLIKIIVLSMYQTYRAQAFQAGVDSFLVKGSSTSELVRSIMN